MDELAERVGSGRERVDLLLIGRRELRTNNSWMHNVPALVAGRERCVLLRPSRGRGSAPASPTATLAVLESRVHNAAACRCTSPTRCAPASSACRTAGATRRARRGRRVAGSHPGVSVNDWTDDQLVESVVGQSMLNGVPVRLRAMAPNERADAA